MLDLESEKKYKIILILLFIYILGVGLYYFIGCYDKYLGIVPDERLYIQTSKAIANGDGMCYNGLRSSFQKILYSLVISPAYRIKNLHVQIKLICLLGTLFEMTSIFPIYLISRKLSLSRIKSLLICILSLSFPAFLYSMTFMSESAFLPLWLWVIYIVLLMLDKCEQRIIIPVILGVVSYLLYLCKEVGVVAIPALFLTTFIDIIKRKDSFKKIIPSIISGGVFCVLYFLGRFVFFGGVASSYSYKIMIPQAPENSINNPASFFLYAFLFYLGYIILVNNIFPLFLRSKKDGINLQLSTYIEISIIILLFTVVYKITLNEDYGLMSPRLHFRYFEPLFIPYFINFIARIDDLEEEYVFRNKYLKFTFVIYLVVLIILPGFGEGELLDSTTTMVYLIPEKLSSYLFLGSPQKTVIFTLVMKLIIVVIISLEVMLLKRNRKAFFGIFISFAFAINISGTCMKYNEIRREYALSRTEVDEMQVINDELSLFSGRKLIVVNMNARLAEVIITYYDINDTDVYLAEDEYDNSEKDITLKVTGASREVNIDDYSYIVYENGIWEDDRRNNIPQKKIVLSTENFFVVEN